MAENDELIAFHPDDFRDVQAMHREWLTTRRPQAGVQPKKRQRGHDFMRVMVIDDVYPVYTPREERSVAYFVRDLTRETITVEMFGSDLAGDVNVTIDGTLFRVNCQYSTAQLRTLFGFSLTYCRVTAFSGLWEFAFAGTAPEFTAEPAVGTSDILTFAGGLSVVREGWVSVADDRGRLMTVDVVDALPFAHGEVKRGAIAVAMWSAAIGWLVEKWHCREFNFRMLSAEEGGGDGGGVGEVVGGDTEPEPNVDPPVEEP